MKGLGSCERIFEILDTPSGALSSGEKQRPRSFKGKITFNDVSFSYGKSKGSPPVLSNFSLTIPEGQVLGIVGSSGSGKSTLGHLLLKLYSPESGSIILDDSYNLNDVDTTWWHDQISVVPQEPVLFSGTIAENISYGCPDATLTQIEEATTNANAMGFIDGLPSKTQAQVGERGLSLSGGQKQRVALARAWIKNTPVILLDEATSALDSESERLVQEALKKVACGRTVILIAHRLSTIRQADKIAVLEGGRIVEAGTFKELMDIGPSGLFYKYMQHQQYNKGDGNCKKE